MTAPGVVGLGEGERRALLDLARRTVRDLTLTGRSTDAGPPPPGLHILGGAFVTLKIAGELRGCIGTFDTTRSLWNTVHAMAEAAAARDPRFDPVNASELDGITIEISALSPPRPVTGPDEIEVGRHGIEISRGRYRGVLLPQVATEHDLDRETFLAEACRKAQLPSDAWRLPDTSIRVFEADVFGDR